MRPNGHDRVAELERALGREKSVPQPAHENPKSLAYWVHRGQMDESVLKQVHSGHISAGQAAAIAEAAPDNPPLQKLAGEYAKEGASVAELQNFVQAVRASRTTNYDLSQLAQDAPAMEQMKQMGKNALAIQRKLSDGVIDQEVRDELKRWINWGGHQDLVEMVREANGPWLIKVNRPWRQGNALYVQALLPSLQQMLPTNIPIYVLQSIDELPQEVRDIPNIAESISAGDHIGGIHHLRDDKSTVYLIADNLPDDKTITEAYYEEVLGHAGMQQVLTAKERTELYDFMVAVKRGEMDRIAKLYRADLETQAGRDLVLNEMVAKAAILAHKPGWDSIWRKILDLTYRSMYKARILPKGAEWKAFDAKMRTIARRGLVRLASE